MTQPQIDWSKAPEDATHGRVTNEGHDFYKYIGKVFCFMNKGGEWEGAAFPENMCTPRPAASQENSSWDGEGLPPVGTECEFTLNRGKVSWERGVCLGHDGHLAIIKFGPGEYHARNKTAVRPIRTPEQIAAEKRKTEIKAMRDVMEKAGSKARFTLAAALYDAGYRKADSIEPE